jgi:hypothetical protein
MELAFAVLWSQVQHTMAKRLRCTCTEFAVTCCCSLCMHVECIIAVVRIKRHWCYHSCCRLSQHSYIALLQQLPVSTCVNYPADTMLLCICQTVLKDRQSLTIISNYLDTYPAIANKECCRRACVC